ncbi:hypothetical protein Har1129_00675 [Haloarcula sp. CBA1129]|nr:hypothetical protein Har1129_00675 [Haloarcula sp. CBA1129]
MTGLVELTAHRRCCLTTLLSRMRTTMPLSEFRSDDEALSAVTIVALLIVATLLISVILALFILGMGG